MHELNPQVSTDCVVFGFDLEQLKVLLIDRQNSETGESFGYALPGDLIYQDENLDMAANRILKELTGIENIFLEQVGAFGDPDRLNKASDQKWIKSVRQQPNERVITVAYYSLVNLKDYLPQPSSFASNAAWISIPEVKQLAFDHYHILQKALMKLRERIMIKPVGFNLLPEKFTFGQLHKLYETILQRDLDRRNFRRKMIKLNIIEVLDEKQIGVAHKPSRYLKFHIENYQRLVENGFDNFSF